MSLTSLYRPKPGSPAPWSLINSDRRQISSMAGAASDPTLVVLSEWTNYTSREYMKAEEDSQLDILYASPMPQIC